MVAMLISPLYLSRNQSRYEPFNVIGSRFQKPVSDHRHDLHVRHGCMVKSRGIDEDNRIAVSGMCNSDGSNFCFRRLPTMVSDLGTLIGNDVD